MKTKEQKQATYLNQIKIYLRMLSNAAHQIDQLWMKDNDHDLDLNDYLHALYPFNDSFDQVVIDIKQWVTDYERQISGMDVKRPFVVEAQRIPDLNQLNPVDQDCLEEITEPYYVNARTKDEALDIFHDNIPIKVLDDFEITVKEVEE